ncbi:cytochrome P450 [Flagelloscypha sp. PMI_526]|nr:cytochrome P450 [Flagelloscypha sp. PMI_526]
MLVIENVSSRLANIPVAALVSPLFLWVLSSLVKRRRRRLPPGPRGWPIIGSLLDLPKAHSWHKFQEWSKQYGSFIDSPTFTSDLPGQDIVLLGSHKVASDLLDKRSAIYSGRPKNHVVSELLFASTTTGGLMYPFIPVNNYWKKARRASHECVDCPPYKRCQTHILPRALKLQVTPQFQPLQLSEARQTIENILKSPHDLEKHIVHSHVSYNLQSLFGTPALEANDPRVERLLQIVERGAKAAVPGTFLVEAFTWMQYLPDFLAPWRVWALEWSKKDSEFLEKLYYDVDARMKNGQQHPCVASSLIENETEDFTAREKAWTLASIAFASDTISTALVWFVWVMGRYPEVQTEIQQELDKVVGRERMPDFNDFESLPFLRATVIELLRWIPIGPVGIPHSTTSDDVYRGYFIPKGTMCISNVCMINRDPTVYGPDADLFRPSRHIDPSTGKLRPPHPLTHDESQITYGFGRRICVGRAVANQGLFVNVASLLWAFKIEDPHHDTASLIFGPEDYLDSGALVFVSY